MNKFVKNAYFKNPPTVAFEVQSGRVRVINRYQMKERGKKAIDVKL